MDKIAFILSDLRVGGAQRVVVNLSDLLIKNGYDVTIVLFDKTEVFFDTKATIVDLGIRETHNILLRILNIFLRIIRTSKRINGDEYTHVISFLASANFYNSLLKNKRRKTIISIRNYKQNSLLETRLFSSFIYKRADKIISVSKSIENKIIRQFPKVRGKVETIYNPISNSNELLNDDVGSSRSSKKIITVGRLVEQKAQWLLIAAFNNVVERVQEVSLHLCGDGPLKSQLQNFVNKLGISEKVTFHGEINNIENHLLNSDIFVLSSLNEGFPNAILEAMKFGLPIVSTDCESGPREILSTTSNGLKNDYCNEVDFGLLVPAPIDSINIESSILDNKRVILGLEKAILLLLNDETLYKYYSKKSRMRIMDFNETKILEQWIECLN